MILKQQGLKRLGMSWVSVTQTGFQGRQLLASLQLDRIRIMLALPQDTL